MAGDRQIGVHEHAAGAIRRRSSVAPSGDAATPAAHRIVSASIANVRRLHARRSRRRVTGVLVRTSTPRRCRSRARGLAQRLGERREHVRPGLEQDDAGRARIEMAEIPRERLPRDLGECAGQLDAGRPSADDDERELRLPANRIRLALGAFERHEHAATDLQRVLQTLQTGRIGLPVVMAEVRVGRAGGHDQVVVRNLGAVRQMHGMLRGLDAIDLAEQNLDVPLSSQDPSDGRRDVARRQPGRRDLIEERLKDVMIAAIDDGDVDGGAAQCARGIQPTKSTTDDEHAWHVLQQYVIGCSFGEQVKRLRPERGEGMSAAITDQSKTRPVRRRVAVLRARGGDSGAQGLGRRRGPGESLVNAREHSVARESIWWPATDDERRHAFRRRGPCERVHRGADACAAEPGAVRQAQDPCTARADEPLTQRPASAVVWRARRKQH